MIVRPEGVFLSTGLVVGWVGRVAGSAARALEAMHRSNGSSSAIFMGTSFRQSRPVAGARVRHLRLGPAACVEQQLWAAFSMGGYGPLSDMPVLTAQASRAACGAVRAKALWHYVHPRARTDGV